MVGNSDELHSRTVNRDVRELGAMVGDVIKSHASTEEFALVEDLRTASIDYRSDELGSRSELHRLVEDLTPAQEDVVARAFTTYFELINVAEERQRVRAIRSATQDRSLEDSIDRAAEELAAAGDRDRVSRILGEVRIEPVFTAHPTEARRRTVKSKLRSVAESLARLDERRMTDRERRRTNRRLRSVVRTLWLTPQVRHRPPDPLDEAANVQWYLENVLFDLVGDVYDELDRAFEEHFGETIPMSELISFRSWAGSDRDGNPNVTPDVTEATLERHRSAVIERYRSRLDHLIDVLSQHEDWLDVDDAFADSLAADLDRFPEVAARAVEEYPGEPYRQKLMFMRERLARIDDVRPGEYRDPSSFRSDIDLLIENVRRNDDGPIVDVHLEPLRRQVETFGFSLARLDLRDHRKRHTAAVDEIMAHHGMEYGALDEDGRVEVLTKAIRQDDPVFDIRRYRDGDETFSDTTDSVIELFDRLGDWQIEYGSDAIDTYCISMTEAPSHVLEVLFLADLADIVDLPGHSGIDIVPLFETETALATSREIMTELFENDAYMQAVAARDSVQEIMLGYSDSNKENGFLAANWDLYRNQRRLARVCAEYDVTLRLFHGRGGSISRGGGPMNRALLALPNESVTGPVKFTEQGESIGDKYGNPRIAERNLEQMINAQLRARSKAIASPTDRVEDGWLEAFETMASAARDAYRDLLETEGFVSYYEHVTPIEAIEELNIGSRPASRTGTRSVEDLRAIPWVFSWTQTRCIIPGWYSLAAGIDAYLDGDGTPERLRRMYRHWPFFRTTIDNAALSLAQTDMEIAAEYADLAPADLRSRFFPRISDEHDRAVDLVTMITERDRLLRRDWLAENLSRRNPYVDPLNLLQVHLLGRSDRGPIEEQTVRLTIKGIAAGMKNTG